MSEREPAPPERGELWEAIQALGARLGEALTGPEAQRVRDDLDARMRDLVRQIDQAVEGSAAQALKERVAALVRTVQAHLGDREDPPPLT